MPRAPLTPLPALAPLAEYDAQSASLLSAFRAGDDWAVDLVHQRHPRFLRPDVPWLPKQLTRDEVRATALTEDDARLAIARWLDFKDWSAVETFAASVQDPNGSVARFERAVDAALDGDMPTLKALLAEDPALVHARSTRVTHFDPSVHRATLLHYMAANGVEGHRQKTPANAVEVVRTLLEAGADANALADLYGGQCSTMSLLVSSDHPAKAGVQVALVDLLADFGARLTPLGGGSWTSPVLTALAFNFRDAAEALVRRGAPIDTLAAAAGLNRVAEFDRLLPDASAEDRHRALALAAQLGHAEVVARLLRAGENPDRYNPKALHAHATPLHHAALYGHLDVVRALVEAGARLDMRDTTYQATPLGWAEHGRRGELAGYLRGRGAPL